VPSSYRPEKAAPVVFSLHGFASSPWEQQTYSRWEDYAEGAGWLAVYPQGSSFPLRWNTGPRARLEGVDDVRLVEDILADLSTHLMVDPARIFVNGFSNGAEMTHRIACNLSDRIAAIGAVSGMGPDGPEGCPVSRPVPVIAFSGEADPLAKGMRVPRWVINMVFNVSVEAEPPGPESPEAWIRAWAERNQCEFNPVETDLTENLHLLSFEECSAGAQVTLYRIANGGHAWPGGSSIPMLGRSSPEIDATATMGEFFLVHPMEDR
jgi:polyhydroxybutyrate depolymerase